jgi:hypothetical protein
LIEKAVQPAGADAEHARDGCKIVFGDTLEGRFQDKAGRIGELGL